MTPRDKKTRAAAPRQDGIWHLGAERRWIVQGDAERIATVTARLGRFATRLTAGVVELRFGNAVGRFDGGPLGPLSVQTGKWSEARFEALLQRVAEVDRRLTYAGGGAASLGYTLAPGAAEVPYQAFAHLRTLMGPPWRPKAALTGPLESVLAQPHRRTQRAARPLALARRVEPPVLVDLVSGRWPSTPANGVVARRLGGRLPERVEETVLSHTVDTPENRFAKHVLTHCRWVVDTVQAAAQSASRPLPRLETEAATLAARLETLARHRLWGDVGALDHFPAASTVLQRRWDYRALLDHYTALRNSVSLPLASEDPLGFLDAKDIAALYEIWACYAVVAAVEAQLGPPAEVARPEVHALQLSVRWRLQARWSDGTAVYFNRRYERGKGSWSLPLRPDVVLTVPAGPNAGHHVFDAKFKMLPSDTGAGAVKPEDLHKMHTYRDALHAVQSAWALYPGDAPVFHGQGGEPWLPSRPRGVGAIPLSPERAQPALHTVVANLLSRTAP